MKSLESDAFYACNSLASVKLPNLEKATSVSFDNIGVSSLSVFLDNTTDINLVTTILNNFHGGKSSGSV